MRKTLKFILATCLIGYFFLFKLAFADQSYVLSNIKVEGLQRVHKDIFFEELQLMAGAKVKESEIYAGILRLNKTQLFSKVNYQIVPQGESIHLVIIVEERWTTIPILKVSSGGGVGQFTLGLYDPNVFGKRYEVGGQFERLGDTNSGVLWLKKPHFLNYGFHIDFQFWDISRLRTKYEQEDDEPVVKTGFLQSRQKVYLGIGQQINSHDQLKYLYEYNEDQFTDELTSDEVKSKLVVTGLPPNSRFHFLGLGLERNWLDLTDWSFRGHYFAIESRFGLSEKKDLEHFGQIDFVYKYYLPLREYSEFAQRILAGFTSTEILQYWYYLGGLDRIRGFSDNRFAGRYMWLSNSEYRQVIWKNSTAVFQGVGFLDVASAKEEFKYVNLVSGASIGLGVRVIFPKIYRLIVRIDYAQPIKKEDDMNLSFGVQQFF